MSMQLLEAVKKGNLEAVQRRIEVEHDKAGYADEDGMTALLWAAKLGHNHIIDYLLKPVAGRSNLSERNNSGWTALLLAAANGNYHTLDLLLTKYQVSLRERSDGESFSRKRSALSLAFRNGHVAIVQHLLQLGVFINLPFDGRNTLMEDIEDYLGLEWGASYNNPDKHYPNLTAYPLLKAASDLLDIARNNFQRPIDKILSELQDAVNARDESRGNTALHWAVIHKNRPAIRDLINAKALYLPNDNRKTPLDLARDSDDPEFLTFYESVTIGEQLLREIKSGNLSAVQKIISENAKIVTYTDNNGLTALLWAATCGHNHIVDYLLGSGGSRLSEKNNSGLTAMLLAALNGKNKTLELLLEKYKVSLVEQDDDGSSALSLAGGQGHVASVQHLLQLGAFIDLPLKNGRTLVQKIKQYQNHAALPLLKAASKLFSIPNNKSSSALNIYLTQRRINKLLHVLKGSVNARRVADGNTALHVAILNENLILAHALVKANAHLLKNNKGETPLDLAKQSKNPQLLTLFTTNTTDTENTTASEIKSSKETQETKPSAPPQHSKDINAVGQDMTRAVTLTPEEYKIHKETQKIVPPAQKPPVPPKRPSILLQYEGLPDAPLAPTATNHSGYPDPILNEPGSSSVPNNPIPKILKRNKFLNQKVAELNKTVLDLNQRILDLERRNQELKEQLERKKTINTSPPLLDTVLDPAEEEGSVVPKQSSSPKRRITNFS